MVEDVRAPEESDLPETDSSMRRVRIELDIEVRG